MKTMMMMTLTAILFSASVSQACTVMPLDQTRARNELAAAALSHLKIDISHVQSVQIENFQADYIWTPMCPKGTFSEGEMTFTYLNEGNSCSVSLSGKKHDIYEDLHAEKFQFNEINSTCAM